MLNRCVNLLTQHAATSTLRLFITHACCNLLKQLSRKKANKHLIFIAVLDSGPRQFQRGKRQTLPMNNSNCNSTIVLSVWILDLVLKNGINYIWSHKRMPPASFFISLSVTQKKRKKRDGWRCQLWRHNNNNKSHKSSALFSLFSFQSSLSLVLHLFVSSNVVLTMVGKTGV